MTAIQVPYLLLMHSCVASSLLFAIYSYQIREQKSEGEIKLTAGFPFFLFNMAWISSIVAILSSSSEIFLICLMITAIAIFITVSLLFVGVALGERIF